MKARYAMAGLAVAAAMVAPQRAEAINREWSAVLGFVGGYALANAVNCPRPVYYEQPVYVERPVYPVYVEQPVYVQPAPVFVEEPAGYYEWQPQRIWVQGCWVHSYDNWGYRRRMWQPGYYRTHQVRVWVQGCRVARRHHRRW